MDKPSAVPARTFPTAQEDAEKETVSPNARYEGPESAYRLAFTDIEFLLREALSRRGIPAAGGARKKGGSQR